MPGVSELLLILVIVLVIFGAGKLPQIGDALGRGIRNFKRATSGGDEIDVTPKREQVTAGSAPGARAEDSGEKKA
jgi:sec-independent protein translocase protein TatA